MIETFAYISEPYDELNVYYIDYNKVAEYYPAVDQSLIYREINKTNKTMPYILSNNKFIFCIDDSKNDIINVFSTALNNVIKISGNFNFKSENMQLSLNKNQNIFHRIIRESLMRQYKNKAWRGMYGVDFMFPDDSETNGVERILNITISSQLISNSILFIMDIKHKKLDQKINVKTFRKYSIIEPYNRYQIISKYIKKIFTDEDKIYIKIPGNKDLTLNRVKPQ